MQEDPAFLPIVVLGAILLTMGKIFACNSFCRGFAFLENATMGILQEYAEKMPPPSPPKLLDPEKKTQTTEKIPKTLLSFFSGSLGFFWGGRTGWVQNFRVRCVFFRCFLGKFWEFTTLVVCNFYALVRSFAPALLRPFALLRLRVFGLICALFVFLGPAISGLCSRPGGS